MKYVKNNTRLKYYRINFHIKNKNADLKTAVIIGICGIAGAIGGSLFAMRASNDMLRRMFGIFLLLIGLREVYKGIKSFKNAA